MGQFEFGVGQGLGARANVLLSIGNLKCRKALVIHHVIDHELSLLLFLRTLRHPLAAYEGLSCFHVHVLVLNCVFSAIHKLRRGLDVL